MFFFMEEEGRRVAMANNANLPMTFNTGTDWVHNCWTTHVAGPGGYSQIKATFCNWYISTDSEAPAGYDFTLRAGLLYNGTFYPFYFNGSRDVSISKTYGQATTDPLAIYIPPGARFQITNRRVANDAGVAGSYDVLANTGGSNWRNDGVIAGTDNTQDFTLGVGIAYGATINPLVGANIVGGVIQDNLTLATPGQNYTAGPNVFGYYGPAGAGVPGALHPGTAASGYGNPTPGTLASVTVADGGASHNISSPPIMQVIGANTASTGFGTASAVYGPSMISGVTRSRAPSVLLLGDSNMAGYGSTDIFGDINGNFGVYEQALANRYGCFKMAVSGTSAAGWLANNTHQLAYLDTLIRDGLKITHTIIAFGTNDFLSNLNSDVLQVTQANVAAVANAFRARGSKIILTTIPPATDSSDSWATLVNQTTVNTNYDAFANVFIYNTFLLAGVPANDGVINIRSIYQDPTATTKWRVDLYGSNKSTSDGRHGNNGTGIPYAVANMTIPTLN